MFTYNLYNWIDWTTPANSNFSPYKYPWSIMDRLNGTASKTTAGINHHKFQNKNAC